MPQLTQRMAVVSSKDVLALTTVDVYELASSIGVQFEKMIDCHGPESVTGLMPMVIRVLEHLEEMTKQSETEQAEVIDLKFTVERMLTEKKLKAEERLKFEKELEQIEEMWKSDARRQRDAITRLEEENNRLSKALREKMYDAKIRDEEENRLQELSSRVHTLQDTINKQREEIRSLEKELISKNTDIDMLQAHVEHLTRANEDHRRRSSIINRQAQQLVEDKADLQAVLHDKEHEVIRIRSQLKRLSSLVDPTALGDITSGAVTEETKRSSKSEMKNVSSEPSNLQRQVDITPEVLEPYKPDSTVVDQGEKHVNEEELEPPVQGPINREPEEKLFPDRRPAKDSGIRRLFKHFLDRLEKLKFSDDDDNSDESNDADTYFKFLLSSPSKPEPQAKVEFRSKPEMRSAPKTNIRTAVVGASFSHDSQHGYCWQ